MEVHASWSSFTKTHAKMLENLNEMAFDCKIVMRTCMFLDSLLCAFEKQSRRKNPNAVVSRGLVV